VAAVRTLRAIRVRPLQVRIHSYRKANPGHGVTSLKEVTAAGRRAGYYHGAIDGIMGPATRRAIRAYERDHGYVG